MQNNELLPCPFCGSNDVEVGGFDVGVYVQCCICLCQGPEQVEEDVAINDWNSRASALAWTTEPPRVPGWYFRRGFNDEVSVLYIDTDNYKIETRHDLYEEWAGPITQMPGDTE